MGSSILLSILYIIIIIILIIYYSYFVCHYISWSGYTIYTQRVVTYNIVC